MAHVSVLCTWRTYCKNRERRGRLVRLVCCHVVGRAVRDVQTSGAPRRSDHGAGRGCLEPLPSPLRSSARPPRLPGGGGTGCTRAFSAREAKDCEKPTIARVPMPVSSYPYCLMYQRDETIKCYLILTSDSSKYTHHKVHLRSPDHRRGRVHGTSGLVRPGTGAVRGAHSVQLPVATPCSAVSPQADSLPTHLS